MDGPKTRWERTLLLVASIGPLGYAPASGSVTVAAVGLPLFWLTNGWGAGSYILFTLLIAGASIWIHHVGDRILDTKDSGKLVWDEVVGFLFAVALLPFTWQTATAAFLIERVLDIKKVPPARWVEDHWPGGFGVVGDDVVAGLYTAGAMHLLVYYAPNLMGIAS